ncbi:conserved hypothetical protein [Leishmania infantum JPCM5]|uniref:Uncharacterized protein n=2 Tax=Leishmania infantum TaxID=5671 RepID=A4HZD6_LEIIN|nr:conserved hypothetical protein [Leishmania infantum JPCM5]CAC9486515.1 hypothetical_protein_-_conserved [Leishmania infantum]CAM67848.1 conserved hypothetical protein [Leishmania infantum JPCM5]SUZ41624.1 hypothetical_protein_-_conserved [Leishmania infantum]|eukprot:XP_001465427.1 conserved hypothetical protein [Leishmania infantum JPCM5]
MIFTITNAVLSAIFLMLVVVPPLYIYSPDDNAGESNRLPSAGEVLLDESVTQGVKQRLYLLVVIPTCTTVNALFLYFAYYRPVRFVHYRVELNLLTLRWTLEARRQQLQKSGVLAVGNRSIVGCGVSASSFVINGSSVASLNRSKMSARNVHLDQGSNHAQRLASTVNWEWRRHVRPKSVRKDTWVSSAVFAEIGDLRDQVEQHFLAKANVAEANFTKAVVKTVGVFVPPTPAALLGQVTDVAAEAKQGNAVYLSSRPPLSTLGSPRSGPGSTARHGMLSDGKAAPRPQGNAAPLVPAESLHPDLPRGSTMPANSSGGGSAASCVGSEFALFRGGKSTSWGRSNTGADLPQALRGNVLERTHEPAGM